MNILDTARVLRLRRHLLRHDHWTRPQLEAHQARALQRLRRYAYQRSPFYQRFHQGYMDRPLHELPVLTKAHVMEHFDEVVTDRAVCLKDVEAHLAGHEAAGDYLNRYWVSATSGSTGFRGLFLAERSEAVFLRAAGGRAAGWAGIAPRFRNPLKVAAIMSTASWVLSTRIVASLPRSLVSLLHLDASEPLDVIVERLNRWQPEVLQTYPSVARILAEEQLSQRLRISPGVVTMGAEVLTEDTQRRIQEAWGVRPTNQYGTTESGLMAAECDQHEGMHVYEDCVIAEVVDKENQPVAPGHYGDKLLLTILFKRAQPLIRYEVTDMVRMAASPCPCGRPYNRIEDIQGRIHEVLRFPARAGGMVNVHPVVFHYALEFVPATEWQVVQEQDGLHVLLSGVRNGFEEGALVASLQQKLTDQGAVVPPIIIETVSAIPRGATGKAPLIKSNLPAS